LATLRATGEVKRHVSATASTKNQELLRELGSTNRSTTKQNSKTWRAMFDLVLDLIGGETQERSWSVLKNGGVLLSLVQPPSLRKRKRSASAPHLWLPPSGAQLTEIAKLIDSGELKLTIDRILPLSEVRRAHELSQSGHTRGKIVLRVKEEKS